MQEVGNPSLLLKNLVILGAKWILKNLKRSMELLEVMRNMCIATSPQSSTWYPNFMNWKSNFNTGGRSYGVFAKFEEADSNSGSRVQLTSKTFSEFAQRWLVHRVISKDGNVLV